MSSQTKLVKLSGKKSVNRQTYLFEVEKLKFLVYSSFELETKSSYFERQLAILTYNENKVTGEQLAINCFHTSD